MTEMDAITTAQAPDTFDVLSFIEATAYPTETVTVYTDAKSATDLLALNEARKKAEIGEEKFDGSEYDAKIDELTEKVKNSILTFELRGMPPGLVRDLYDITDESDAEQAETAEAKLVASTIISVKNYAGTPDARVWDAESVKKLKRFLKEAEYNKLVKGVIDVNFNASVFDQATDAGFLGGSADVGA